MAEGQEPYTPPPDRSRRAAIFATLGIVVILGLAVFLIAVLPLWQTHREVRRSAGSAVFATAFKEALAHKAIARLGGPERAMNRLMAYLRLPDWIKPDRAGATLLLGWCGPRAMPVLLQTFNDPNANTSLLLSAIEALGRIGPEAKEAVPALIKTLEDKDWNVRVCTAWALGQIGPEAKAAAPALCKLLEDKPTPLMRRTVEEALVDICAGTWHAPKEAP